MEIALKNMSIKELEGMLDRYPWFTLARRELFLKMSELGEEHKKMGIRRVAGYVYSRERLLKDIMKSLPDSASESSSLRMDSTVFELDFEEVKRDSPEYRVEKREESPKEEKEIFIIGGDYFKREDFESLSNERNEFVERKSPITVRAEKEDKATVDVRETKSRSMPDSFSEIDDDALFYTESLAKVYASQGFYKRAIGIYEKLILLYPEKNSYFATLIKETKKNL